MTVSLQRYKWIYASLRFLCRKQPEKVHFLFISYSITGNFLIVKMIDPELNRIEI